MRRVVPFVVVGVVGGIAVACGGSETQIGPGQRPDGSTFGPDGAPINGDGGTTGPTGLPCDVDKVLAQYCRTCHGATPTAGAPMPLTTWDSLQAPAKSDPTKKVYELVSARIKDNARPMPQAPNPRLASQDVATIDAWIAAGTPKSATTCTTVTPDAGVQPLTCTPDQTMAPASAWTMPQNAQDEYVCYGVDVTAAQKRHIIAIAPVVDNPKIVHHVLLFQTDQTVSTTPRPCSAGGGQGWRMMFGWAPGGKNIELPPEAGFPQEGTTHYAVQVHYNNAQGLVGEQDKSGFKYCTGAPRANDADVMAFGNVNFSLPPNSTRRTTCQMTYPAQYPALTLFAALPHMHKLGLSINTTVQRGAATPMDIGTANPFDFQNQVFQEFKVGVAPGDVIRTICNWRNTTGQTVGFGEGTADEMCYSFTMYYPKITASLYNWQAPAGLMSTSCQVQ